MREIKFRVWDGYNKEMIYCDSIEVENSNRGLICYGNFFVVDNIMQYTGLKDKNRKEIYEGDIVCIGNEIMEVFFEKGAFKVYTKHKGECLISELDLSNLEIIGNIYEHKHLLKTKNN